MTRRQNFTEYEIHTGHPDDELPYVRNTWKEARVLALKLAKREGFAQITGPGGAPALAYAYD